MLGNAEVVVAGGQEAMSRTPYLLDRMRTGYRMGDATVYDGMYRDGFLDPLCGLVMGETAENLARRYEISREEQDEFALRSQQKAAASWDRRAKEIEPIEVPGKKGRDGRRTRRAPPARHHAGGPGGAEARLRRRRDRHARATRPASPTARRRWS